MRRVRAAVRAPTVIVHNLSGGPLAKHRGVRALEPQLIRSLAGADLDSASYIDLAGIWNVTGKIEVRAGMNNVLDKEPPNVGQAAGPSVFGNGFPGLYDALGRYWFAAVGVSL